MTSDMMDIIGKLRGEAVDRCRKRIQQAAEKKDGCTKRARSSAPDYGVTSIVKRRHGL